MSAESVRKWLARQMPELRHLEVAGSTATVDIVAKAPAGGSLNTSVEVATERRFDLVGERWVGLCDLPGEAGRA